MIDSIIDSFIIIFIFCNSHFFKLLEMISVNLVLSVLFLNSTFSSYQLRIALNPSDLFPSNVLPSDVLPSDVLPSDVFPSDVLPSDAF